MESPFDINIFIEDGDTYKKQKLPFTIRFDTKIHEVKEKIYSGFAFDKDYNPYYPKFQRLFILQDNNQEYNIIPVKYNDDKNVFQVKDEVVTKTIISEVTKTGFFKDNILYVESILNRIAEDPDTYLELYKVLNSNQQLSEENQETLEIITSDFPEMDTSDLLVAIDMVLSEEIENAIDSKLFKEKSEDEYKTYKKIHEAEEKYLKKIPVNPKDDQIVNDITERTPEGMYKSGILNILVEFDGVIDNSGNFVEFIDLYEMFNQMEATENVPFISIGNREPKSNPFIKVFKDLKSGKEKIDKWILTESKSTTSGVKKVMKLPMGLTFRLKNGTNYNYINLFRDGRIKIRMSWSEKEKATIKDVVNSINNLSEFIQELNEIRIAFKQEKTIPLPSFESSNIREINSGLIIKLMIDKNSVYNAIEKNSSFLKHYIKLDSEKKLKDRLCKDLGISERDCKVLGYSKKQLEEMAVAKGISLITDTASRDQVNIVYNKVSKRLQDKFNRQEIYDKNRDTFTGTMDLEETFEELDTRVLLTIKNSEEFKDHMLLLVKNTKSIAHTNIILDLGISLLKMSEKKEKLKSINSKVKEVALEKIKSFKESGIPNDPKSCQKKRQPVIDGKVQKGSYSIIVNGYKIVCTSPDYPYPGYTNKGIPCCFKAKQQDKTVFKKFTNVKGFKEDVKDIKLDLTGNAITKNKVLLPGKRGILLGNIGELFNKLKGKNEEFYRIGVYQQEFPFISVIFEIVKNVMNIKSIDDFRKELANFLDNGTYFSNRKANNISIHKSENFNGEYSGKLVSIYESLGNGLVARKLKKEDYIKNVLNNVKSDHTLLLDLLTQFVGMNIFIFDEKKQNIICYSEYYNTLDSWSISNGPSIILLKNSLSYEPIYLIRGSKVTKIYSAESPVSKKIKEVYQYSCDRSPSKKTFFSDALTARQTYDLLTLKGFDSKAQLVSAFNETIFIIINNSVLIPVKPSGPLAELKITKKITRSNISDLKLRTAQELIPIYKELSKKLSINLNVISQVLENGRIVSVILGNGFAIPTKESSRIENLEVSKINFVLEIDNVIRSGKRLSDERVLIAEKIKTYQGVKLQTRFELSKMLQFKSNSELKDHLEKIVTSDKSNEYKFEKIQAILLEIIPKLSVKVRNISATNIVLNQDFKPKGLCRSKYNDKLKGKCSDNPFCAISNFRCAVAIPKKYYSDLVDNIAYEMVQDTNTKDIISGRVVLETSGSDVGDFIKRPGEVILFDVNSAIEFLKK